MLLKKLKQKRSSFACWRSVLASILVFLLTTSSTLAGNVTTTAGVRAAPATNTTAISPVSGVARITWNASPSETSGSIDAYRIYYKLSTDLSYTANTVLYLPATLTKDIGGLTVGSNYDFKVMALGFDAVESRADCLSCEATNLTIASNGPSGTSLTINDTSPTTSLTVSLTAQATNATEMYISGDVDATHATYGGNVNTWIAYSTSKTVALTDSDGIKSVSIKYRSADLVESSVSTQQITLARPPTSTSLTINDTSPTTSLTVSLTAQATNATEMYISGDVDATHATYGGNVNTWIAYSTSKTVALTDSDGIKSVSIKYRSADLVESSVSTQQITLNRTVAPPAGGGGGGGGGGGSSSSSTTTSTTPTPDSTTTPATTTEIVNQTNNNTTDTVGKSADATATTAETTNGSTTSGGSKFTDLTATHWSYSAVESLSEAGVLSGYPDGTFQPDRAMNRAELTKVALLSFKENTETNTSNTNTTHAAASTATTDTDFPDIASDSWYGSYITEARSRGIVSGYDDGLFRPTKKVTRAEALKILIGATGFTAADTKSISPFEDVDPTAWYTPYVDWAAEQGIITGYKVETPSYQFTRTLRIGNYGSDVGALQYLLGKLKYYRGVTSHYFGYVTQAGLLRMQRAILTPGTYKPGVLDQKTQATLYDITGINRGKVRYEFRPGQTVTRAEAAQIAKMLRELKQNGFTDLHSAPSSDPSQPALDLEYDLDQVPTEQPIVPTATRTNNQLKSVNLPAVLKANILGDENTPSASWLDLVQQF